MRIKSLLKYVITYLFLISLVTACGSSFVDETASIMLKPTIVSIVLDPPEAAPGDKVTASYLLADEYGTLKVPLQVWTLTDGSSIYAMDAVDEGNLNIEDGDIDSDATEGEMPEDVQISLNPVFDFTVPEELSDSLEESEMVSQIVMLLVGMPSLDMSDIDPEDLSQDIKTLISSGDVKTGLRTLIVSDKDKKNQNPKLTKLTIRIEEDGEEQEAVFVSSFDKDIEAQRKIAIENPYVFYTCNNNLFYKPPVSYCPIETLYFKAEVEDDAEDLEKAIRYQWISNAGDFQGRRNADQVWSIPCYFFHPDYMNENNSPENPLEPREDVNLHPIYLVLRDNGVEDTLGQSWAEFYVRIKLVDCD